MEKNMKNEAETGINVVNSYLGFYIGALRQLPQGILWFASMLIRDVGDGNKLLDLYSS